MPRKRGPRAAFRSAPAPLKSLSVFAAANTRDRVGRLMPTSCRSTYLVSATSRIPGALRCISALGNSISALPGALRGSFAPGKWIIVMPGVQKGFFAPGNPVFALPGALRGFSAPGNLIFALLGANGYCFAPGRRKPRRQKVFFLNWGVRPVGEGLGKAQPQQDPLATDPVPAGAGSEDGSRAGPSPTGKRDNAAISKQSPADRQTGKTAETKQNLPWPACEMEPIRNDNFVKKCVY